MSTVQPIQVWVTGQTQGDELIGMTIPNPVVVTNKDTMLKFVMKSPNYLFDKNAIRPKDSADFVGSWTSSDAKEASLLDLKTQHGDFEYWVYATRAAPTAPSGSEGGSTVPLPIRLTFAAGFDPVIQNNE